MTEKQYVLLFFLEYSDYRISIEALDFHVKNEKKYCDYNNNTLENNFHNNIWLTKCMVSHKNLNIRVFNLLAS